MLQFIKNREGYRISSEDLEKIENKYGFKYPDRLRDYFLNHNEAFIYTAHFTIGEKEYSVDSFVYPFVKDEKAVSADLLLETEQKRGLYGKNKIPFASDRGDNTFCWDSITGEVYLSYYDGDEVNLVTDSIDVFFDCLEK